MPQPQVKEGTETQKHVLSGPHARPHAHLAPDLVLAQRILVECVSFSHGGCGGLHGVPAVVTRQSARCTHVAPKAHAACAGRSS